MIPLDIGHQLTEKELEALERRIAAVYRTAAKDMKDKIKDYFESFVERDKEMKALIGEIVNGKEWTEKDYKQWRLAQIGRGQRFEKLRDQLAERMTKANQVVAAYINDATPGIYSLNRNYAAYTIEQVAGMVGFTLWDEQTVRRLLVEEPDLMPYYPPQKAVKRGIDLAWGKKQITTQITQAILQGEGLKKMADRLQKNIPTMNRNSAIRAARTAFTSAQNGGRMDSYAAAEKMGIKVRKRWIATKDGRTRHSHRQLDGETIAWDEKFSNGCRYPGDTQGAPSELYNCRCTMRTVEKPGIEAEPRQMRVTDPKTGRNVLINEMTYEEWETWKKTEDPKTWEIYQKKSQNYSADKKQYEEYKKILGKHVPSTLSDFQDMKYNDSDRWSMLKLDKSRRNELICHPEQALPGKEKIAVPEKFTKYLFNPNNPSGWAKGQAFMKRLGYSADNYEQLQNEILDAQRRYPAKEKGIDQYGTRYEQKMVLYGPKDIPTNVVVGWILEPSGNTRMTSAYIKEV